MSQAPEVTLRPAVRDDAATVHRLLVELAAATGKAEEVVSTPEDIERYGFDCEPGFACLLAFAGGEAVGLAVYFYEFSTWRGTPGVYIQDLYVSPKLRGGGFGRRLVDAVCDAARRWGSRYVKLAVHGENPGAVAFYHRIGFESSVDEKVMVLRY